MLSEKRMIQEDKPSFRQTAFLFYFCRNSRHARNLLCLSRDAGCCCRFFCFLFVPVSCSRKNRKRVKTLKDEDAVAVTSCSRCPQENLSWSVE